MARKITVDVVGNAAGFNRTIDQATAKLNLLRSTGAKGVLKGVAIGAGVAGFNLLTTAISGTISKLDEMHQAFLDDEASQQRLALAVKNSTTAYEDATKAAEAYSQATLRLGFADEDTRDSIAQLIGVTHDMTEALKLVGLAQDLARAKNIDLAQATDVVNKAYNGQARGLAALGVDVRGAANGTELLARAFQNVKGASEAYAKTGPGKVAAANVKMGETMERLGGVIDKVSQVVIPVMVAGFAAIVDFAGEVIGALTKLADFIANTFSPVFQTVGDIIRVAVNALFGFLELANSAQNVIGNLTGGATPQTGPPSGVTSTKYGVPIHHNGGIVQGPRGSDQLIMAQAGETVIPAGGGGQTIVINIASFIGSDRDIDRFSDRLAFRLRSTALS